MNLIKAWAIANASLGSVIRVNPGGKERYETIFEHAVRVSAQFNPTTRRDEAVVGLLHDVVEDTEITLEELIGHGLDNRQHEALEAITRRDGEPYFNYIERVSHNQIATRVKVADLFDNLIGDPGPSLTKRYLKALRILVSPAHVGIAKRSGDTLTHSGVGEGDTSLPTKSKTTFTNKDRIDIMQEIADDMPDFLK